MADDTHKNSQLARISGVNEEMARALHRAGYQSIENLRAASEDDLAAVDGISTPLALHIKHTIGGDPNWRRANDPSQSDPRGGAQSSDASEWHTVQPRSSSVPATPPYYEETLSLRFPGGFIGIVVGHALLFTAILLGLIVLYGPVLGPSAALNWGPVIYALLSAAGFGALWGANIYTQARVFVEVTDAGLEVVRNWNSRRGALQVTVPFESISRVQVTEDIRPHRDKIEREYADTPLQAYMVTNGWFPGPSGSYRKAVRIERTDEPPVYVGSARPEELATVLGVKARGDVSDAWGTATGPELADPGSPSERGSEATAAETLMDQSDETEDAGSSETFDGTVPGMSEEREKRGLIAVLLFAVGMIVAVEGAPVLGVFVVLGVLGVMFVWTGIGGWLSERRQLATFEPTRGTVTATKLVSISQKGRRPLIKYEYSVDGQTYQNDKIWPGSPMAKKMYPTRSHDFISQYPEGEETTVYYDPANPSDAFIHRSSTKHWYAVFLLAGLAILGYLVLFILGVAPPPDL